MNPFAHLLETYESETRKTASVWSGFADSDLGFRPHAKSSTVGEIFTHQLLSERRFFDEFLGLPEPPPASVLPAHLTVRAAIDRMTELAMARIPVLAVQDAEWWHSRTRFFDVERERIWIFWRRVLHTAHHRTQLTVYLRLLEKPVPSTYGPTADVTWDGADPTLTLSRARSPESPAT